VCVPGFVELVWYVVRFLVGGDVMKYVVEQEVYRRKALVILLVELKAVEPVIAPVFGRRLAQRLAAVVAVGDCVMHTPLSRRRELLS
jgi:hypothetical protein